MRLAILGNGSVARALRPILDADKRFTIVGIHSRSRPAAASVEDFLDSSRADALVELTTLNPLTGEPAIGHIRAAFSRNMHVVTANKGPIANAYYALQAEAEARYLHFRFESSVMDGAPVFNLFRDGTPRLQVLGFVGVLNSTSNIVIEAMEQGRTFDEGLTQAQHLGIAEADASYDLDGWDSAAKAAALANVLMDGRMTPHDVERAGIGTYTPKWLLRLNSEGKTVRLVSRARRENGKLRISAGPEILPKTDILAAMPGTSNLILFETDLMGTFGTVSLQPGVAQTAFGVYADLVSILARC